MKKREIIKINENQLKQIVSESVKRALNEISADLADRAASKAYQKAREGFGKYGDGYTIPFDSPHGKKYLQGEKFLRYRNDKLGLGNDKYVNYPRMNSWACH